MIAGGRRSTRERTRTHERQRRNDPARATGRPRHGAGRGDVHPARHPAPGPRPAGERRAAPDHPGRGLQGPERRQYPARALPGGARPGEDPRLRGALPRGMVGQASRRVRLDRQGRHPRRVAVSDAGPPRRRDGERAGRRPRLLAAFRDGRGVHLSGRPEHPARGALPRDRVGAHHLASAGDGAGVRDVRHPGGHGVPLLHPLGYPRGRFGPTVRYPTSHTTSWDEWGKPPPWA